MADAQRCCDGLIMVKAPHKPREPKQANTIRLWRKHRNLTLEQLAERADMSASNLSLLERGLIDYTGSSLAHLAEALGCDPPDLIMRDPSSHAWSIYDTLRSLPPADQAHVAEIVETFRKAS